METIKDQKKVYGPVAYDGNGTKIRLTATVRHDDECGNGHNSFSITADGYELRGDDWVESFGGCCHDEIAKHFPELAPFIKWHLTSTDGPMHYIANTVYHAENGDLKYARGSAVWPDATIEQLKDKDALTARLPKLLKDFQKDVESLDLTF
jgi:hypothetical protein